ncbi:MAG: S4 domain-containing protein, partial [Acidimicrobiia bacterium]|nr:S4 domain-containing protein [Acidimicrobiia bacterium]
MEEERTVDVELPDALDGQRVDRVVALVAEVSRSAAADLLTTGRVLIDGAPAERASQKVAAGSRLVIRVAHTDRTLVAEPEVAVPVLHADDAVVVVDKP